MNVTVTRHVASRRQVFKWSRKSRMACEMQFHDHKSIRLVGDRSKCFCASLIVNYQLNGNIVEMPRKCCTSRRVDRVELVFFPLSARPSVCLLGRSEGRDATVRAASSQPCNNANLLDSARQKSKKTKKQKSKKAKKKLKRRSARTSQLKAS